MTKNFVPVSVFRDQINFAFDAIQCHWHACVTEDERILWFVRAMRRFNDLYDIGCKRATAEDCKRYESVFDLFAKHTENNFLIWLKARLVDGSLSEAQYHAIVAIECDSGVSQSIH